MRWRSLFALAPVGAAGCILIVGPADRIPVDAAADVVGDGAVAPCALDQPFLEPVYESALSTSAPEESVRLTPDELEAFVSRRTSANLVDIFHFRRDDASSPWIALGEEPNLSRFEDGGPTSATSMTFTPDALEALVQYYDEPGSPNGSLARTTRTSSSATWSLPTPAAGLESNTQDNGPWLSSDGSRVYFFSARFGNWRIFTSTSTSGSWTAPSSLQPILPLEDRDPVLTGDELTMFLAANDAPSATDKRRIFRATRASVDDPFQNAVAVMELNVSGLASFPSWVSADGCRLYFLALRPGKTSLDVYSTQKPPL